MSLSFNCQKFALIKCKTLNSKADRRELDITIRL